MRAAAPPSPPAPRGPRRPGHSCSVRRLPRVERLGYAALSRMPGAARRFDSARAAPPRRGRVRPGPSPALRPTPAVTSELVEAPLLQSSAPPRLAWTRRPPPCAIRPPDPRDRRPLDAPVATVVRAA